MKIIKDNPNFSILLPSTCNASCKFCFWNRDTTCSDNYLELVRSQLNNIPDIFDQISLTGGEPTRSKYFAPVLDMIDKNRWKKVVLTTNGNNLMVHKDSLNKIDFINISRHHWDDAENYKIFGTETVPSKEDLKKFMTTTFLFKSLRQRKIVSYTY